MSLARDAWLIFRYQSTLLLRRPLWLAIALFQPLLYLCLFGPLLEAVARSRHFGGDAWQVFVPGLLVQLALFGSLFVGFGLVSEMRDGVFDRLRVTPVSSFGLVAGRVLRDVLVLGLQGAQLLLVAIPLGFDVTLAGAAATLGLVALVGVALSSFSYAAAVRVRTEDALAQLLNLLSVPTLLLSGILLPMSLAPPWLFVLSRANPLSYIVDGARDAFQSAPLGATFFTGIAAAASLAIVGFVLAVRSMRGRAAEQSST